MHLIQLLLPLKAGSEKKITQTREELVDAFEGVTAYDRAPAKGAWLALASRFGEQKIHIRFIAAEVP